MRALSIRQPWAELILSGRKGYELRSRRTTVRGRIWIHASKRIDRDGAALAGIGPDVLVTGALVGTAEIVGCVPFTREIAIELRRFGAYFGGEEVSGFAWQVTNPRRLLEPIPMRGMLGFFSVPDSIVSGTTH